MLSRKRSHDRPTMLGIRTFIAPCCVLIALVGGASACFGQSYSVTDLQSGTAGGSSSAAAINNSGQIVGTTDVGGGVSHAYVYTISSGILMDLGDPVGARASNSAAFGINDSGDIVGQGDIGYGGYHHGFLLSNGGTSEIIPAAGYSHSSTAYGVSAGGLVVGVTDTSTGAGTSQHGFTFMAGGRANDFGSYNGYSGNSAAFGVNASGTFVGQTDVNATTHHAFANSDPGNDGGPRLAGYGTNSTALAINVYGDVVGESDVASGGPHHAFLYTGGVTTDLGTLNNYGSNSVANAINDSGVIVGESDSSTGATHAFIYTNGMMTDLNTLITTPGWVLTDATGIDNNGDIVGTGINPDGLTRGFLLAAPEPGVLGTLTLCGAAALLSRRRAKTAPVH